MQQPDEVTLTIDGKEVSAPKGSLVIHAAQKLGIDIPSFCYNNKMDPLGACRMCLVAIEKQKGFPPSCATPVGQGMVVNTKTPEVEKTRKSMLEFLLINHPLDCPICDKGGECPLQNLTFKFGSGLSRYIEPKRHFQKHLQIGPQIVLDRERCILCQLCVRFMEDIADDPQLVMINRGDSTEIGSFPGRPFDSVFSGNTTDICPVGALTSKSYRFQSRPWDLEHTPSVCPSCAVGCNIDINTRRGQLMRLAPRENTAIDDGWLCDIGRYGTLSWARHERVTSPLIKKNGRFLPASWSEALQAAEEGLRAARAGGAVAGLASARATNEELYLFGKVLRGGLRSPHVDTINGSRAGTDKLGGAPIAALEDADALVVIDGDPIARQMVLHLRVVKQAKRRGIAPVLLTNDDTSLDPYAAAKIGYDPTHLAATIRALSSEIRIARLHGVEPIPTTELAQDKDAGIGATLAGAAQGLIDAVRGSRHEDEAPSASLAPAGVSQAAGALIAAKRGLVIYDERVLDGPDSDEVLAALHELEGTVASLDDLPTGRLLALARETNSRGAAEMGARPALVAGGGSMDDLDAFNKVQSAWGLPMLRETGRDAASILAGAANGEIDGLFLLESDILSEWPDEEAAKAALARVSFLLVQTPLLTPTAQLATVVLPSAGFAEKSGTLTNLEGRVQSLGKAKDAPGEARDGWDILGLLAGRLGIDETYESAGAVTAEIAAVLDMPSWKVLGAYPRKSLVAAGEGA